MRAASLSDLILGATAGCAATVPMSLTMDALHRRLPLSEQYPLPPRQIAMQVAHQAGLEPKLDELDEDDRYHVSLAAHFGMGATAGSLYPLLAEQSFPAGVLNGAGYGLAVWAANYLGILPALGLLTPATRHPKRRTGVMIAAHIVWGAALGGLVSLTRSARKI